MWRSRRWEIEGKRGVEFHWQFCPCSHPSITYANARHYRFRIMACAVHRVARCTASRWLQPCVEPPRRSIGSGPMQKKDFAVANLFSTTSSYLSAFSALSYLPSRPMVQLVVLQHGDQACSASRRLDVLAFSSHPSPLPPPILHRHNQLLTVLLSFLPSFIPLFIQSDFGAAQADAQEMCDKAD